MQAACRIYEYHIGFVCFSAGKRVERHRCRVRPHLLLHNGHSHALAPNAQLLYGSCAEGVGSPKVYLLSCLFELPCQLAYGGGFAYAVDAHYKDNVRCARSSRVYVRVCLQRILVLCQKGRYFVTKDAVKFACRHILVTTDTFLYALDYLKRCLHAHVRRNEHLFKVVKHIVVDLRLSHHGSRQFVKHGGLCFFQSAV